MKKSILMRTCAFLALPLAAAVVPSTAQAQQITASVDGQVNGPSGAPVANATVTVTDNRTNNVSTYTTGADGRFSARNLTPGGPYTISASAAGFQGQTVENVVTSVAATTTLSFDLAAVAAGGSNDAIVVTAQRANVQLRAIGPGTAFGAETLEGMPSINRDVRDIVRIDPRVSLERENEVDRVSCLGGNDRANTFTVDGIVQADVFGLNGTPFAARNALPIPFDAIRETSVEFSPFDVEYGQFTGCAINVVTKSGSNRLRGSAFYVYNDEKLTGSKVEGENFDELPFKDTNWGLALGGPIIRDRLFFFLGYEEVKDQDSQEAGPVGGGFPNDEPYITVQQAEEIGDVLSNVYGIDPGPIATQLNETNLRYFGRIDANITDNQRLELTYQKLKERNVEPDDFFGGDQFTAFNAFEEEGTNSQYYSGRLYSQWSDNFSTELRVSRAEVGDVQGPVGGGEAQSDNPTPRFVVGVENNGEQGLYIAGPGQFRSANQLDTKVDQAKLKGELDLGAHVITVGGEINKLDVFNLFIVNATGTLIFQDIDALREGLLTTGSSTSLDPDRVLDNGTSGAFGSFTESGDPAEAAAEFGRTIYSAYAQDEWQVNDQLSLLGGLRLEWYDGDAPRANPTFQDRYGFSNAVAFDALGMTLLPRLGATYDLPANDWLSRPQLKGGIGVFAGGDPTVWFSNAFSNNGFASGFGRINDAACAGVSRDVVVGGQFTGFPECVRDSAGVQAGRGLNRVQSTDPNIKLPTVTRANIGFSAGLNIGPDGGFLDGWRVNLDYIYSRYNNPYDFVDLAQTIDFRRGLQGYTIDGRPIYGAIDPTRTGCDAELVGTGGPPPEYRNVTAACFTTTRDDEIQLTNADGYSSSVASVILAKRFSGGVFGGRGSTNVTAGYAFTDSNNRRDHISAQSTSNFDASALLDRQAPGVGTSGFETRHNFTLGVNFREEFIGRLATQFGLFFSARSGRPFSYTFDGSGVFTDPQAGGTDNAPLYVPRGMEDPNVVYENTVVRGQVVQTAAETQALLNGYINRSDCLRRFRGEAAGRNACRNDWYKDLDLRLSQDLPGVLNGHRAKLFVDFDNFLNFIDSEWNVSRSRAANVDLVDVRIDSQGRYVIRDFNPDDNEFLRFSSSVWRVQAGVRYEF